MLRREWRIVGASASLETFQVPKGVGLLTPSGPRRQQRHEVSCVASSGLEHCAGYASSFGERARALFARGEFYDDGVARGEFYDDGVRIRRMMQMKADFLRGTATARRQWLTEAVPPSFKSAFIRLDPPHPR